MNKFLIYVPNLDVMPKGMNDVIEYAKCNEKFRIANVELNNTLASVKAGDQIITGKGNVLYVAKAISESKDNWDAETVEYIDTLTREHGLKKCNITSVDQIIKFETWCKSAKVLVNPKNNNHKEMKTNNSLKNISARLKDMFMPKEATGVKIATDGSLCVETANGYVSINADNELTSYPEELTIDFPVYVVSKPASQLAVGDVVATERGYAKVTKIDGAKISAISYTGTGKVIHTIKDFLFNQTNVRVVVSLAGNLGGGSINPMMLLALSGDGDKKDSLLPLLMMSQNNGTMSMNPMMLALLSDGDSKSSFKDIALLSMMGGNNLFGGLFGGNTAAASDAAVPTSSKSDK